MVRQNTLHGKSCTSSSVIEGQITKETLHGKSCTSVIGREEHYIVRTFFVLKQTNDVSSPWQVLALHPSLANQLPVDHLRNGAVKAVRHVTDSDRYF